MTQHNHPRPYAEVLADAVKVLTEAARLTDQPLRRDASGDWEADPDAAPLPIDWAAFVTHALAGAAANIGGTGAVLAGRPGSWEAAKVRDVLESTVGADDESLLEHRTEPVVVDLLVDNILLDLDDPTFDQYDAAYGELDDRENAVIDADKAAVERIAKARAALDAQQERERDAYATALEAAIREHLGFLTVPVNVTIRRGEAGAGELRYGTTPLAYWSDRIDQAVAEGIKATPTPASLPGTPLSRLTATS
jgi:hypothetical protein